MLDFIESLSVFRSCSISRSFSCDLREGRGECNSENEGCILASMLVN